MIFENTIISMFLKLAETDVLLETDPGIVEADVMADLQTTAGRQNLKDILCYYLTEYEPDEDPDLYSEAEFAIILL